MRPFRTLVLGAATALIAAVTLPPAPGEVGRLPILCVFCGDRATADALANVVLYLPLGAAIAWWAPASRVAWRFGPVLSLAIELAQRFIAGRDASIGDVIANTIGTLAGWAAWRYLLSGGQRPTPREWPWAAAAFAAVVGATVWLLQPSPTSARYFGMWTPVLGHLEWYRGRVLGATVDRNVLPPRLLSDPTPVRAFVRGEGMLYVRFIAGPQTTRLAPLVSVFDEHKQEIMLVGPDRDALVLRYRRHAATWKLDEPDVRFEGAVREWTPGDTIAISVSRTPREACLTVGDATECVTSVTPGAAWSMLLYPESFPAWLRAALNALWPGGLMLLLGWSAGTLRGGLAGGAIGLAALVLLPPLVGGAPSPPAELAAAIGGLPAGLGLRRWTRRLA